MASRSFNPISAFLLIAPQIQLRLTIVRVYKLYLFTYLLTGTFCIGTLSWELRED